MSKQSPFKALVAAVEALGGKVDQGSGKHSRPSRTGEWGFDVAVDAPEGKVWRCTGTHSLVCELDDLSSRAEMNVAFDESCQSMLDDVLDGAEDCEDTECDECGSN